MKPVLFLTGHVAADRAGAFEELHARCPIELALYGGRHQHGAPPAEPPARVPHRAVAQRDVGRLVSSGAYRAVIAGTGGRVALPAAWGAARRQGLPFVFWAALWRTPRTAAHLVGLPLMHRIYREATAVVTYGEHVSAYVRRQGAKNVLIAPQAVDNRFWSAPGTPRSDARFAAVFVARAAPEKGLAVALEAWRLAGVDGTFTVVGEHGALPRAVRAAGRLDPEVLRNLLGVSDVLVVPSIASRRFIEPWGLVVNEAMNQGTAIIATDAVGAAAGGLVRHERNGLVVRAGDAGRLARALAALANDRAYCAALGEAGRVDVATYTYAAWADAFVRALDATPTGSARPGSVTS